MKNIKILIMCLLFFYIGFLSCLFYPLGIEGGVLNTNGWLKVKIKTPKLFPYARYLTVRVNDYWIQSELFDQLNLVIEEQCCLRKEGKKPYMCK